MIPSFRTPLVNRSTVLLVLAGVVSALWWVTRPVEPEVVVDGQRRPGAIAIVNGRLHWTTVEDGATHVLERGSVVDLPAPQPTRAPYAYANHHGSYLVGQEDGAVHWTVHPGQYAPAPDGMVVTVLPGATTFAVSGTNVNFVAGLAAAGDRVFWVADGSLWSHERGAPGAVVLNTAQVISVAADDDSVYWMESAYNALRAADHDGGNVRDLQRTVYANQIDATDPHEIVIHTYNEIVRVPKAGGPPVTVASPGYGAFWRTDSFVRIAVSGGEVFATTANGRVMRVSLAGGEPVPLVKGLRAPFAIAVDDEWVYWSEPDLGRIRRIRR